MQVTMNPRISRQGWTLIAAGGSVLFLSIGSRQGFGLFFHPISSDLGLTREQFSRGVAVQYLLWGLLGPIAGLLAERYSARATLLIGGLAYAAGYVASSVVHSTNGFIATAGMMIGLGLGGASYGVVNAAAAQAVPSEKRGAALGVVAACTALGQLLFLYFTQFTIDLVGWRDSLRAHGLAVLAIVPLALLFPGKRTTALAAPGEDLRPRGAHAISAALVVPSFWLMGFGFAFSGLQVMFTMTHLPAWVGDLGMSPLTSVQALAAVSLSSFVGSWLFGRLCDGFNPKHLLIVLYVSRAFMAALAGLLDFTPATLVFYFAMLGLVWLGTIPVTSHLTASLFGTRAMASLYGVVFLMHQVGGFAGTWLGGVVFDRTGSYQSMWVLIATLCLFGAVLACFIAQPRPESDATCKNT